MRLLILAGILILWWIFAIYSVSIFESFQITTQKLWDPSNYFYFIRHLRNLIFALIIASIVYFIPLRFIKDHRGKIFLFFLFLQLLIFTPLWVEYQWARWWLDLWFYNLQPSEFFKLAFLIFFSGWLLKHKKMIWTIEGFIAYVIFSWIFYLIFLKIPDLGTILVLAPVGLMLYWYAWWKIRFILVFLVIWFLFAILIGSQIWYVKKRIDYFINPDIDTTWRGIWWQTKQALIAIWAGGFFGQGYGKWLQKLWYIPEAQSDFVFAAYSEEIGFLGNFIFLALLFSFLYLAIKRLPLVEDEYYRLLAFWIIALIFWQSFVNIWVNLKILPLTGLTLPFVSYWWTSLVVTLISVVLLYKILYKK